MPRQTDTAPISRPAKRRRSPTDDGPREGSNTPGNSTPGSSTPQATGKAPLKKRILESSVRPSKRARSPLTSSQRPSQPDPSPPRSPPPESAPPRKRPGRGAGIDPAARRAVEEQRRRREEEERRAIAARNTSDLVSNHYNAVPQRGREWRKTDSSIRGLRSFNNWVKSALIQKFSLPEQPVRDLLVLDIGCGKGGDLQKWQAAPQMPALYVGIDPASVSIEQARSRYEEMKRKRRGPRGLYEAHFFVQDCFGESVGRLPIVREVGFDPNAGPDANGVVTGRFMRGGFDVISMMFCLHYSFESEEKARGMLKNVAGALKKGGRFLGVMPNSDVLSTHVEKHLKLHLKGGKAESPKKKVEEKSMYDDDWDPEKPAAAQDEADWDPEKSSAANDDDEWDPEKPSAAKDEDDWDPEKPAAAAQDEDDWDPEKPSEDAKTNGHVKTPVDLPPLEWGNSIYKVKFTQTRPLPTDGVFRPPYGWKYHFLLEEAVDVPEYVVPWEGFRALAEDYGLELQFRKSFSEIWEDNKDDRELSFLADRMGVRTRDGRFNVTAEEMEAASFYHAFCFYKI
ncbi:mRNA cap guanine-N7 methyltransferase-like protein [Elsinoe australis]|uniref:mRNA cap guanine-N(7) methyltransferase n=1 Tax=Elsinoe australis TaxID=40998 RepID=A0A4U7B1V5_9PEZI|nr:mRNA cap guanine-N7 methyltransferase-like protein [Elsinoe australis]